MQRQIPILIRVLGSRTVGVQQLADNLDRLTLLQSNVQGQLLTGVGGRRALRREGQNSIEQRHRDRGSGCEDSARVHPEQIRTIRPHRVAGFQPFLLVRMLLTAGFALPNRLSQRWNARHPKAHPVICGSVRQR